MTKSMIISACCPVWCFCCRWLDVVGLSLRSPGESIGVKNSEDSGLPCYAFPQESLRLRPCDGIAAMRARWPLLSRLAASLSICRLRRRRKGRGSREAGKTGGCPRGCESGEERSDEERGGGTPPADWGQQARSALLPACGGCYL